MRIRHDPSAARSAQKPQDFGRVAVVLGGTSAERDISLKTGGAVMVTGSHNPPDYNGFKMMLGGKPFFGEQIRRLGQMARDGDVVEFHH